MKKKIIILTIIFTILITINITSSLLDSSRNFTVVGESIQEEENKVLPKKSDSWDNFSFIHIKGNWSNAVSLGWCNGDGSWGNPYIIENMTINATNSPTRTGILIENSKNAYFEIKNCTVYNALYSGIQLLNTNNGTVINNTCYDCGYDGISLIGMFQGCNNNTIVENNIKECKWGIILYVNCNNNSICKNNASNCDYGILLTSMLLIENRNNSFIENSLMYCGFSVDGIGISELSSNQIDSSNRVNEKPLYYYVNQSGLQQNDFNNAGQILLYYCNDSVISDVNISQASLGIFLQQCINIQISNCSVSRNDDRSIADFNGYENRFLNCTLEHNKGSGIFLYRCFNDTLSKNKFIDCGIVLDGDDQDDFLHNITISNRVNGNRVYYFQNQTNLKSPNFTNPGQIILFNCNDSIIENYEFYNASRGIAVYYCNNVSISNITAYNNDNNGIYVEYSENNTITHCNTYNCDIGLNIVWSNNNTIIHNNATYNIEHGVYLDTSDDNKFNYNNFSLNSEDGTNFDASEYNEFSSNIFTQNGKYGLNGGGSNNLFYNNTFINNGIANAYDSGINDWNNTYIGNYWDDYIGKDANDDGCGDPGYEYNILGGSNQDNLPIFWDAPVILIGGPLNYTLCGETAPIFTAFVSEGVKDNLLYTLNDSMVSYNFSEPHDQLNQTEWNKFGNGTIIIHFYANDSRGWIGYEDAVLRKDIIDPIVTIKNPQDVDLFGKTAPNSTTCEVEFYDPNGVDSKWYMLINGTDNSDYTDNYTWNGYVDQLVWNDMRNGTVILRIFANDSASNIGFSEVLLRKDILGPNITINDPQYHDLFLYTAPGLSDCDVSFSDPNGVENRWYMLINGTDNSDYTDNYTWNGYVEQLVWNDMRNGTIIIRIFANDSAGNIGFSEVLVRKDIIIMTIAINFPHTNDLFGISSPNFTISVSGSGLDTVWYMLYNSSYETNNYTFLTSVSPGVYNDKIDQGLWEDLGNGTVWIKFFLNKTDGTIVSDVIKVLKDKITPYITYISPSEDQGVVRDPPTLIIYIREANLHLMWYAFYNGSHYFGNYTFTANGTVDETAWHEVWDSVDYNTQITLIFYANDTIGNLASKNRTVVKQESQFLPVNGDDDGDDGTKKKGFNIVEFLSSPIGLGIVGGSTAAAIGVLIMVKKRISHRKRIKEIERIKRLRGE